MILRTLVMRKLLINTKIVTNEKTDAISRIVLARIDFFVISELRNCTNYPAGIKIFIFGLTSLDISEVNTVWTWGGEVARL